MTKQLERLMFVQGERCFFCEQSIPEGEASVEHLVARANGGVNGDQNCVACCKSLNALLSSHPLKEKLRVVLNQKGRFKCPRPNGVIQVGSQVSANGSPGEKFGLVVAHLKKLRPALPRKVEALRNTIASLFQKKLTEDDIMSLVAELQSGGYVVVTDGKVAYELGVIMRPYPAIG